MNKQPSPDLGTLTRLIQELNRLPGIGLKSAQRIAYFLLRAPEEQTKLLAEAIVSVKRETKLCSVCFNVTEVDPCYICQSDRRDRTKVCIVEQPQDIVVMEHTGIYYGLYHVLHGAIAPAEGVSANDIRIMELLNRLRNNPVDEVILATNTNLEGEHTALYLKKVIMPLGIRITRLARGLPFGSELEYADDVTLTRAIEGRQEL